MTAEATRTLKEARALFYPWCAMMIACTFPLFSQPGALLNLLFLMTLFIGIPLLACLSFGNEFRHKTMELLVSQPVSRLKIWREKWVVAATAIMTISLVAFLCNRPPLNFSRTEDLNYLMFLVITTCSAAFWTLFAKSTLGGLMLNIATVIPLGLAKFGFEDWNASAGHFRSTGVIIVLTAATLAYSAAMLWLGRWLLIRQQSGPGFAGVDIMVAIPILMPGGLASVFRSRVQQPILNLLRKELQMLRPLFLLSTLYVLGWSAIAIASPHISVTGGRRYAMLVLLVIGSSSYPVVAMFLAASLPLSEERAYGTQLWHLTLPLSMKRQWLIRGGTGLLIGLFCGFGITSALTYMARLFLAPVVVRGVAEMGIPMTLPILVAFFVFLFWCAVIARDMARTALLVVVASAVLSLTYGGSYKIADWLSARAVDLATFLISRYQLNPSTFNFGLGWFPHLDSVPAWMWMAGMCVAMTFHTYLLFRELPQASGLKMIRPLAPYLAAILVFVPLSTVRYWKGYVTEINLFYETEKAIVEAQPPNSFTLQDLVGNSNLPGYAKQWLRDSKMTMSITDLPVTSKKRNLYSSEELFLSHQWKSYQLTISLPNGITCFAEFSSDKSKWVFPGHQHCY